VAACESMPLIGGSIRAAAKTHDKPRQWRQTASA
jgi:hypothetical protein